MRTGDWVEIRPLSEILSTLDDRGEYERMPFMPEMVSYAGKRFRVSASAHKTCDTVHQTGGRKVTNSVHLEDLRCDGSRHGGCQAACLLYWKEAWLRPVDGPAPDTRVEAPAELHGAAAALEKHCATVCDDGTTVYACQATSLPEWSQPLAWWDIRQYWRDVVSGNVTVGYGLSTLLLAGLYKLRRLPFGYRLTRWVYGTAHRSLKGIPDPHPQPAIKGKAPTPAVALDLQEGELVEIRSLAEINQTINETFRNRGLYLSADDSRHCGRRARVRRRVTQIINERTGKMMRFNNPCIVLDGIVCLGEYADRRLLCPRRINSYWREAWLKRVDDGPPIAGASVNDRATCSSERSPCRAGN